ncbi:hypothetical protein [Dactylosporangium sp. NPDC000521]|uniref:hypothetical protein n=1 Tax=Dactylosporangium sp. NPDC000521 TaxID=3363975 RepID=UPI0036926BA6
MGEDPKSTEPPTSDEPPRRPRVLGDTSLRFEPPPQESAPDTAPATTASPRPATTPFGAPLPPVVEAPRPAAPQPRTARPTAKPATPFAPPPAAEPASQAAAPPPVTQAGPAEQPPPVKKAAPAKKAAPEKVAAKKVPAARKPEPPAPVEPAPVEPAPVEPAPTPEAAAPVKKAAKKAVAKKAPAKKAAVKKAAAPAAEVEVTPATKAPVKKAVAKKAAAVKATSTQEVLFPAPATPAPATAGAVPEAEPAPSPAAVVVPEPEPAPATTAVVAPEPEPTPSPAAEVAPQPEPAPAPVAVVAPEPEPPVEEVPLAEGRVEVVEADPTDLGVPEKEQVPAGLGINPAYLPELLALAAVARLGEAARERAAWYAANYPGVDGDAIGRAVTREFVRRARRLGIVAGAAGSLGLVVEAAGVNWLHAKLVLHLAAAHGHDPLDRVRAAELLVLQRVYAEVATAEAAIMAAEQAQRSRRAGTGVGVARLAGPLGRTLGGGLLQAAGVRVARRALPGIGPVIGAVAAVRSTEAIAMRATRYYRRKPVTAPDGR